MDFIGLKHKLDKNEKVIIGNSSPCKIEFSKKGFFGIGRANIIQDITGVKDVEDIYAIPYLTDKRMLLLFFILSKKIGALCKWDNIPIDFINYAKFNLKEKRLEISYKIPHISKHQIKQVLGMKRGKEGFEIMIYSNDLPLWKTHLTKILFKKKSVSCNVKIKRLIPEKKKLEKKIDSIEKSFLKGKIDSREHKRLRKEYLIKLKEVEKYIRAHERELKEVDLE